MPLAHPDAAAARRLGAGLLQPEPDGSRTGAAGPAALPAAVPAPAAAGPRGRLSCGRRPHIRVLGPCVRVVRDGRVGVRARSSPAGPSRPEPQEARMSEPHAEQSSAPVVVAVGHEPIDAALAVAAAEAGPGPGAVCTWSTSSTSSPAAPRAASSGGGAGRAEGATAAGRRGRPGPRTGARRRAGHQRAAGRRRCPTLVDLTKDARLIVLGHRELSGLRRVVTRSVSSGVAAHARVPTVAVPAGWSPPSSDERPPTVAVGLDVPDRGGRSCGGVRRRTRSRRHVAHRAHLAPAESLRGPGRGPQRGRGVGGAGDRRDPGGARHPRGRDGGRARGDRGAGGRAADALVEAGRHSDLLVVGRHDPAVPVGSHLGPVARAVLGEAVCPCSSPIPGGTTEGAPLRRPTEGVGATRSSRSARRQCRLVVSEAPIRAAAESRPRMIGTRRPPRPGRRAACCRRSSRMRPAPTR